MFKRFMKGHRHEHGRGSWRLGDHHGFDRGRSGRRVRAFEQGDLRFVILKLIADEPRHGYDIIKAIEDTFGGNYSPSPGVVYPTLTMLEDQGFATVTPGEGSKKLYTLTAEGRAFLDDNKATVDAIFKRMDEVSRRFRGGPAPEIIRAVENFHTALRLRLDRGTLAQDEIAAIAEVIDVAAAKIERS
ncbi:PadR family transcriptional regulator [Parvibaculum sp.]|uniref:PadR family transcriptional regulator n=1 Tax=Parvibaculum sp. TaxID=2024848 RepID=UPI00320E221C